MQPESQRTQTKSWAAQWGRGKESTNMHGDEKPQESGKGLTFMTVAEDHMNGESLKGLKIRS